METTSIFYSYGRFLDHPLPTTKDFSLKVDIACDTKKGDEEGSYQRCFRHSSGAMSIVNPLWVGAAMSM